MKALTVPPTHTPVPARLHSCSFTHVSTHPEGHECPHGHVRHPFLKQPHLGHPQTA